MSFIRINNRNNFLISKVPEMHPASIRYLEYWKLHKKRCIEGLWSVDDSNVILNPNSKIDNKIKSYNWRWMPSNLYFYVNFGTILHQEEEGPRSAPKKKMRPYLRDIEWEFFYNWIEVRGFSGFEDDEKYSCNRDLLQVKVDSSFRVHSSCINKEGKLKEYIKGSSYLRMLRDKPLGNPSFENRALNLFMLGARGFGKSYMVGVGVVLHELLFDGAKKYNKKSIEDPYTVEIFVGAAISSKSADILKKAKVAMEHLPGSWTDGEHYNPCPFAKTMSGTLSPNNMKNPWRHEYQKKIGGDWKDFGTGSNVKHGIYTTENPEAAAGTRPGVMVVEEVGLLANVLTVHGSNTACQMEGSWKFGSTIYLGTGGNVEKIQESEVIFRDPKGFEFLEFEDDWEGTGQIGWFVPAIYAMNQYKDKNGNTNIEEATTFKEKEREIKRQSKDPSALGLEMMNFPLVPSEMFLNAKGAMFPQAELKEIYAEVKSNPAKYTNSHYYVDLVWNTEGQLEIKHLTSHNLLIDWPVKNNKNKPGVIELFEMPKKDDDGNVFYNRYLQGTDTYDDDESVTSSLGSTWILDSYTDRIVAEYTGRRGTKDFYEICRKLNILYKTTHNYEQNKKGLYTYYDNKNSTHLLCDTPESLRDVADITISKVGNKRKGTTANKQVNAYGLRLILDWLLEPAYGESEDSEIKNMHKIRSLGLLKELINFNPNGNFDRVSAMIMLMIIREERQKYAFRKQAEKVRVIEEDEFFSRKYKTNNKKSKFDV